LRTHASRRDPTAGRRDVEVEFVGAVSDGLPLEVPRDRERSYEPTLVPEGRFQLSGFDDKVIALYARGMTIRKTRAGLLGIQAGLPEIHHVDVGY
jgi:putative transposase